jgi:nucleotide-binding universal stress UspA family protein
MKKILVPVDGSPESREAARQALELAKKCGSDMALSSVVEVEPDVTYTEIGIVVPVEYVSMRNTLVEIKKESVGKMLDEIIGSMECTGVQTAKLIRDGNAQHESVEAAKNGDYDLIVMGHRGLNPIKRLLVGSVAKRVIEDAPCSVLIVKL